MKTELYVTGRSSNHSNHGLKIRRMWAFFDRHFCMFFLISLCQWADWRSWIKRALLQSVCAWQCVWDVYAYLLTVIILFSSWLKSWQSLCTYGNVRICLHILDSWLLPFLYCLFSGNYAHILRIISFCQVYFSELWICISIIRCAAWLKDKLHLDNVQYIWVSSVPQFESHFAFIPWGWNHKISIQRGGFESALSFDSIESEKKNFSKRSFWGIRTFSIW